METLLRQYATSSNVDEADTIDQPVDQILNQLESDGSFRYSTPRQIALLRIRLLSKSSKCENETTAGHISTYRCVGLAAMFVPVFRYAVSEFVNHLQLDASCEYQRDNKIHHRRNDEDSVITFKGSYYKLRRILAVYLQWVQMDSILAEEFGRQGSHPPLIQLIQLTILDHHRDEYIGDCIEEIQNTAGEIAAASRPHFPSKSSDPFTSTELQQRVPLSISISLRRSDKHRKILKEDDPNDSSEKFFHETGGTNISILIHQICSRQSAQVDVGFVMWPSAVALSSLIVNELWLSDLQNCKKSSPISMLELGAGCGLSGLVAAHYLMKHKSKGLSVVLTDFNSLVLDNLQRNINLNDLSDVCSVVGLDFYQQSGTSKENWVAMNNDTALVCAQVDVVLAADVICQPSDAVAVANTLHDTLKPDGVAYIVCADTKHRFGVDHLCVECQRVGLIVTTKNIASCCDNYSDDCEHTIRLSKDDLRNLELTTGYRCQIFYSSCTGYPILKMQMEIGHGTLATANSIEVFDSQTVDNVIS